MEKGIVHIPVFNPKKGVDFFGRLFASVFYKKSSTNLSLYFFGGCRGRRELSPIRVGKPFVP